MDYKAWIESLGFSSANAAAEQAGIVPTTLFRQIKAGHVSAENVIAISRAAGRNTVRELLATGHLTENDMKMAGIEVALRHATNGQILAEMESRLEAGIGGVYLEKPSEIDKNRDDLDARSIDVDNAK